MECEFCIYVLIVQAKIFWFQQYSTCVAASVLPIQFLFLFLFFYLNCLIVTTKTSIIRFIFRLFNLSFNKANIFFLQRNCFNQAIWIFKEVANWQICATVPFLSCFLCSPPPFLSFYSFAVEEEFFVWRSETGIYTWYFIFILYTSRHSL